MIPQGTAPVNDAFFTSLIAAVNAVVSCAQLSSVATDALASLQAEVATVTAQLAALGALVVVPTDLPSVLTWLGNFTAPIVRTQATCVTQITDLTVKLALLTAAIDAKKASLGCA